MKIFPVLAFTVLAATVSVQAADYYVAPNGIATATGSKVDPWDLTSALQGERGVKPGDTLWISGGVYKHPNRKRDAMGYEIRLLGTADKPIQVRAIPGARVTIDGGLNVQKPSAHVRVRDLEIIVSENLSGSRRIEESGSHPQSYDRPWGGLNIYAGAGCKFINLVIHDNAQGVSWWSGSTDSELYGCIIYDNGWEAPDRGHGHAIYTQNDAGVKLIADCIMTSGHGYTLHAYGSSRADVNNYTVAGNIFYNAGPCLIGGGKPSHHIVVGTNYLYGVPLRIGYNAPYNDDCEVIGNVIVNAGLSINNFKQAVNAGNFILAKDDPQPGRARVILRPNHYESNRANVAVFNWSKGAGAQPPKESPVRAELKPFVQPGEKFRLLDPTNFFGQPLFVGRGSTGTVPIPVTGPFAAFILVKE